ncbi:MAG: transglutaminase family protein [Candidatus Xenobiia bacterium LiM19]
MKHHSTVIFVFLLLLLAFSPADALEVAPFDCWYNVFLNNGKIGYEHVLFGRSTYLNEPCYAFTQESEGHIFINSRESIVKTVSVTYYRDDFTPLYQKEVVTEKDQVLTTETKVVKGEIVIRQSHDRATEESRLPCKPHYGFGTNGPLLFYRGLKTGKTFTEKVIFTEKTSIIEEKIEILQREKIIIGGETFECYKVKVMSSALPDVPFFMWIDDKGVVIQTRTLTLVTIKTSKENALSFSNVGKYSNLIKVGEHISPSQKIDAMHLLMKIDTDEPGAILKTSNYQRINALSSPVDVVLDLRLQAVLPEKEDQILGKKWDLSFHKCLRPTVMIESNDSEIIKTARTIAGDEQNALTVAKYLCNWLYLYIAKEDSNVSMMSARETLRAKAGDCTEHAVLFCAFARALGLPSRVVTGLIYTGDSFGYHSWAEVYIGSWVGVDATTNTVGLPACYIEIGTDTEGRPNVEDTVKLTKMLGRTTIEIISVTIEGRELDLRAPSSFIEFDGARCRNLLWNLSFKKPQGWNVTLMGTQKMILEGPQDRKITVFPLFSAPRDRPGIILEEVKKILGDDFAHVEFASSEKKTLGAYSLYELPFTFKREGKVFRGKNIIMAGDKTIVTLTFQSPEELYTESLRDFESIVDSMYF